MYKNLRRRKPISYFEPEEPGLDEYVYCDQCADIVFEYCSIHGPLLVIPDDQIPHASKFPPFVPRAALTIPNVFLHIAPSIIPGAGLGVFTTLTLPRGVRFGPYRGEISKEVNSVYCWQIYDGNNKRSHVVDAQDGNKSNWMRYVNCSRHWREQNLVAFQYQGQLYYRTIKIIPRYTELLIFYGSEFANNLNIDLRSYHSKEYHLTTGPNEMIEETITVKSEKNETDFDVVSDYNDDFLYNDEDLKVETQPIENSIVNLNDDRKSPVTVIYDYENQCFKVEFKNTININKKEELIDKIFRCEQCDFKTNHQRSLKRHALTLHSTSQNKVEFKNTININKQEELIDKKIRCEQYDFKTNHQWSLKRHALTLHSTSQNKVEFKNTININKQEELIDKKIRCEQCDFKTNHQQSLKRHNLTLHWTSQDKVEFKNTININKQEELIDKKIRCEQCDYKTNHQRNLKIHALTQHSTSQNTYKCNQCPYKTNVMQYYKKHYRIHKMSRTYKCQRCKIDFPTKTLCDVHKEKCQPKKFKCSECIYETTRSCVFREHMQRHTKDTIFKCDQCPYFCYVKNDLQNHKRRSSHK